jgi:hypothetical protein
MEAEELNKRIKPLLNGVEVRTDLNDNQVKELKEYLTEA